MSILHFDITSHFCHFSWSAGLRMAQFLHLLSRRFSYPTIQVLFAIILKNYVIERTMDSRFTNTYRPDAIPSVERGWNIINPEPRQSRNRTANCRNKNDERASGKRMSFPECRIRRIAGGIEQRDRRRRGAECTCTMFYRAAYERCTVIRTIRSGNSCNFAAMPGYFCARDVDVRTRAYVLYVLCAWVHQGTGNSGMPGCVEHLSSGTAAPDGIGSMRFIAPERLQPEVRGR